MAYTHFSGVDTPNLAINGVPVTATAAEINAISGGGLSSTELQILDGATVTTAELNTLDQSANTETIDSGVAIDATITHTAIDNTTSGAGAITLAAPGAAMIGKTKIIEMTVDNGDVTLALTNVVGGSAGTTCTWSAVDQALILVGGTNAWHVIAESGVALT